MMPLHYWRLCKHRAASASFIYWVSLLVKAAKVCGRRGSNARPQDYGTYALPTALLPLVTQWQQPSSMFSDHDAPVGWQTPPKQRSFSAFVARGYGATAARLTPDQKVGSSNLSGLILCLLQVGGATMAKDMRRDASVANGCLV